MDEAIDFLGRFDPLWAVALAAVVLGIVLLVRFWRSTLAYVLAGVLAFGLVGALAATGYYGWVYLEDQQRLAERGALDQRAQALFTKALEPDSVFACIDGSPVPAVFEACEQNLFAAPERVAAAVAIVTQRLIFLGEALAFAAERDPEYALRIEPMRKAIEADPYGFVAFVLSVEHGCTHESCARFALFRNAERVRENLRVRRLEAYMAEYAAGWRGSSELPADSTPTVGESSSPLVTISGAPEPAAAASAGEDATEPVAAATNEPAVPPLLAPMVIPPSAATVAADPPAAAAAPAVTSANEAAFAEPQPAIEEEERPTAAKGGGERPKGSRAKSDRAKNDRAKGNNAKGTGTKGSTRATDQAKSRSRNANPVPRSAEPVAGLPRVVPSDYVREPEAQEEAAAQSAAPQPGAPTPISPPLQNFSGN